MSNTPRSVDAGRRIGVPPIRSTRSDANADAHRDFDGWDVDEELRLFRQAVEEGQFEVAAKLAANIDESMSCGGDFPKEWHGPRCMRSRGDLLERFPHATRVRKRSGR